MNEEMTTEELRERLTDRRLAVVAERVGLTYAALTRIMRGGEPNKNTKAKLVSYLTQE